MIKEEVEYYKDLYTEYKGLIAQGVVFQEVTINNTKRYDRGGELTPEQKAIAEQFLSKLTDKDFAEIKEKYIKIKIEQLSDAKQLLDKFLFQKKVLDDELNVLYEKEKTMPYGEEKNASLNRRNQIRSSLVDINTKILHQTNVVNSISNGGSLATFTDKKEIEHTDLPDFTKVNTERFIFDEETILTESLPPYIPVINEKTFSGKGFVFDAIRISRDIYIVACNGYNETYRNAFGDEAKGTHPTDEQQGYVLTTLDQLVLINDYYFTKAKALNQKDADDRNKKTEVYYDSLPVEKRRAHMFQKNMYYALPANLKKKITFDEYEKLNLEEREKLYKPIKKYSAKRLKSKLDEHHMWSSFHFMYERFVDPTALRRKKVGDQYIPLKVGEQAYGSYAHPNAFHYWEDFRDMMKWKILDIRIQREAQSELRKIAMETSFGESNTNPILKERFGILVKRQDGSQIKPNEIEEIEQGWIAVEKVFGNLREYALASGLKISHTGQKYVFASKAAGMFVPDMKTIAVSAKFGAQQFNSILSHEAIHFLDYTLGHKKGKRFASDDFESTAGILARTFRKLMNQQSDSDYVNATKECLSRACEQFFSVETYGMEALVIFTNHPLQSPRPYFSEETFVSKENYYNTIKPLVEKFISENLKN